MRLGEARMGLYAAVRGLGGDVLHHQIQHNYEIDADAYNEQ
jgi:hypothetical protein